MSSEAPLKRYIVEYFAAWCAYSRAEATFGLSVEGRAEIEGPRLKVSGSKGSDGK
jgi:hypothetical protein